MSEICTCRKSVGWFCSFWIKWYPILHVSPVLVKSMIDIGSHSSVVFFKMSRFCDPYCIHNATSITLFGQFFHSHCSLFDCGAHIGTRSLFFHLGCCLEFSKTLVAHWLVLILILVSHWLKLKILNAHWLSPKHVSDRKIYLVTMLGWILESLDPRQ